MLHTVCKVTHCTGRISANTRPHQLRWGDREMETVFTFRFITFIRLYKLLGSTVLLSVTRRWGMLFHAQKNVGLFRRLENMT